MITTDANDTAADCATASAPMGPAALVAQLAASRAEVAVLRQQLAALTTEQAALARAGAEVCACMAAAVSSSLASEHAWL